jgi:alcohol dehydrogenase class IV
MESISSFSISGMPKIIFGAGTFSDLHKIIRSYGRNALIITGGESFKQSGWFDALASQLDRSKIKYNAVSVRGEPTAESIDAITREYRKIPVNVVVAIGGGSVIDCGKAVAAMLAEDGNVKDYLEGVGTRKLSGAKAPFVAVPTTAGTGSEATKNAVVCDRTEGYKKSLRHDACMPDVALVDPELTLTAPQQITTACGFDAITQLIESYTSVKANIFTDSLALKALSFAFQSLLPLSIDHSDDIFLREKMSYAALISGITLSQAGLGAVHGIAGPLGGLFPVPHGVACGKLLFPVMTHVVKKIIDEKNLAAQKRFAAIGRIFTDNSGNDDIFCCGLFLEVLRNWTEILKLPQLSHFGMISADMEKVITLADSKNSPALLSKEEMRIILESIL